MVAVVPASASVWQEPQAGEAPLVKSALPSGARRRRRRPPPASSPPPPPPAACCFLLLQPLVERALGDDVGALAHHRVPEAAQLGADDGERAGLDRLDPEVGGDAGHRVDLLTEGRDPEVVQDVLGLDAEVDLLALRQVELGGGDLLAAVTAVEERPGELLADDADLHLARLGLLDVLQDDVGVRAERDEDDRRDRGPDHLEPRVAVDRRAVLELLARPHAEPPHASRGRPSRRARRSARRRSRGRPTACRCPWPPRRPPPGTS